MFSIVRKYVICVTLASIGAVMVLVSVAGHPFLEWTVLIVWFLVMVRMFWLLVKRTRRFWQAEVDRRKVL
jgi:hypothetical protein